MGTPVPAFVTPAAIPASTPTAPPLIKPAVTVAGAATPVVAASWPKTPVFLMYRAASAPFGQRDTVSAMVYGDHSGQVLHLRLIASDGHAATSGTAAIRGSDGDTEPLWPQWISPAVTLSWRGWKKIEFPTSSFAYRAPAGQTESDAPKLSTVDAYGVDFSDGGETTLLDNLTWTSSSNAAAPLVVDDFETGSFADWQTHGTPEMIQDAQLALATTPAQVQYGRVAFSVSFAAAKQARVQSAALVKQTLASTGQTYLTYVPASPFRRILPTSYPLPGETAQQVQLSTAPTQTESGSFCIYSDAGMPSVTVAPTGPLLAATGKTSIPSAAIDVRVVKVWNRAGTGKYRDPDSAGPAPELLMKDDRESLAPPAPGQLPQVRLTGNAATSIPAHATKQFWVTVTVPKYTAPGHYTTQLAIAGTGNRPGSVTVAVDVLPIQLYSPSKQYVVGLSSMVAANPGAPAPTAPDTATSAAAVETLDKDTFDAQLADVHSHGFLYATLMDSPTSLWDTYKDYKTASLGTPLIYSGLSGSSDADMAEADTIDGQRRANGVDSVAYLAPDNMTPAEMEALHKAKRTTAAFVRSSDAYNAEADALDMPIYSVDEPYVQQLLLTSGKRTSDKYDYWFWPAYEPDTQANRLYAGFLLYRANLYGAFVPNYQAPYAANPFDDTLPSGASGDAARVRPAMATYPVQGGVLDTVQWEAVQAGVNDIRYLTTYFAALRECKDNHVARASVATMEPQVKAMLDKAYWVMSDTDYQNLRLKIGRDTVLLRKQLDAFYAHGGANPMSANAAPAPKTGKVKVGAKGFVRQSAG